MNLLFFSFYKTCSDKTTSSVPILHTLCFRFYYSHCVTFNKFTVIGIKQYGTGSGMKLQNCDIVPILLYFTAALSLPRF